MENTDNIKKYLLDMFKEMVESTTNAKNEYHRYKDYTFNPIQEEFNTAKTTLHSLEATFTNRDERLTSMYNELVGLGFTNTVLNALL